MKYVLFFVLLMIAWLLFTFSLEPGSIITGMVCAAVTTAFFGRHFVGAGFRKFLQPARYFWALVYVFIFAWECLKANLDVAYRVLHPGMPIKPGIVRVQLKITNEIGRTMLANSITMTPGTITMDIIDDYIYIHWIYVGSLDSNIYAKKICGRFEKYIGRIFE